MINDEKKQLPNTNQIEKNFYIKNAPMAFDHN